MAIHLDKRSAATGWLIRPSPSVAATSRATQASTIDLPKPLRDRGLFVPTDEFDAEVRGTVRSVATVPPMPLRFAVDVDDNAPRVAVARHESGAVTFHLAEKAVGPVRGTSGGRTTFTIPVRATADVAPGARRGLLSKIVHVVVLKVVDLVAKPVIRTLARRVEDQLWRHDGRSEGWLRVTEAGLTAGRLDHVVPDPAPERPALLLIHGTFSHTFAAFRDLLQGPTMAALRKRYGEQIYGFDHYTLSKSPKDNVAQLLEGLGPKRGTFDCISHSRGGLVLRTLAATRSDRFTLRRALPVAAPNLGTPLATPRRWEETLGWFANLMEMIPVNPWTTAAAWIAESLSWLAQHVTGDLPGLNSMEVGGRVVADLAGTPDAATSSAWYAIASDYTPPDGATLARLADMGVEGFFQGTNDLVVPATGCWQFDDGGTFAAPAAQIACFGRTGNVTASSGRAVHHLNLFEQPETHALVLKALDGLSFGLSHLRGDPGSSRRGAEREGAASGSADPTGAAPAASAGPANVSPESIGLGWNDEDALNLIVLPVPETAANPSKLSAQLLATYGSARVLVPFRLGGTDEGAGTKWQKIIAFQRDLNACAEGRLDGFTIDRLHEGGTVLFDVLFRNDVRRLYDQARFQHQRRKLNVVFTSMVPWVADLPWEFAYDPSCKSFLALSDVRFVRNVLTPVPADRIDARPGPLRILVVSSVPKNQQPLSEDEERTAITRSFRRLEKCGRAIVEPLIRATPAKLHAKVRAARATYDVVHFIGHGEFDEATQRGYLVFENDRGGSSRIDTDAVRSILRGRGIRLLFLNACVSSRGSRADYNKGVAPGLVADGVPAVVANQYSVLDRSATMFAAHFYWCLVQGLSLGDAVRESRIALNYLVESGIDWAVPVLFARNPNAKLCEPGDDDGADLFYPDDVLPETSEGPTVAPSEMSQESAPSPVPAKRYRVAVWDVADSLPGLERYLKEMTAFQTSFIFEPVYLTAPLGTWELASAESEAGQSMAYLTAERIERKMKNIVASMGVDLLLCVTNLPLRDEKTLNLYLWTRVVGAQGRISIFSIWGFHPPITGERLAAGLANIAVKSIAARFGGSPEKAKAPKRSISYYNGERDVDLVVGQLNIDPETRDFLVGKVSSEELESLERLLTLFHPGHAKKAVPRPTPIKKKPGKPKQPKP